MDAATDPGTHLFKMGLTKWRVMGELMFIRLDCHTICSIQVLSIINHCVELKYFLRCKILACHVANRWTPSIELVKIFNLLLMSVESSEQERPLRWVHYVIFSVTLTYLLFLLVSIL